MRLPTLAALLVLPAAAQQLVVPPGDPALGKAVDAGLCWLAQHQQANGAWLGHAGHKQGDSYLVSKTAEEQLAAGEGHLGVSALCGLAFLAGGHLPDRGRFGDNVRRTLDYVLEHASEAGYLRDGGTRMYSHAFGTLFLAEIYGMVGEARMKLGLERAVHWIVDCQNRQGGWRYNPFTQEADLSVTVCQLQALRAARNIGIEVPRATIDRAVAFVKRARTPDGYSRGLFYYKNEGRGARTKNRQYAINAAAVTSLFSAGIYDEGLYGPALAFLEDDYPELAAYYRRHFYYWYGNYYAAQAFFQAGPERFDRYYRRIAQDLLRDQEPDGRWCNDVGPGDALATAVACLILQIPYQYLPIFQR
jgi:hypothetical protein